MLWTTKEKESSSLLLQTQFALRLQLLLILSNYARILCFEGDSCILCVCVIIWREDGKATRSSS